MNNLEVPLCIKCGYKFPIVVHNGATLQSPSKIWRNPILHKWSGKNNFNKYLELLKVIKVEKDES